MPPSAPSSLRQLIETRLAEFSAELETLFSEAREKSRGEIADQLNQAVRRIRQAQDREALAATLVDAASAAGAGAALFRVEGGEARGMCARGAGDAAAERFGSLAVPLSGAPALATAVESRDPVTAVTTAQEISEEVWALFEHSTEGRVSVYPLVVRDEVPALLYVWGPVQPEAVELLAQVAAAVWTGLEPPAVPAAPAEELVQIAAPVNPASSWESLPVKEQQVHLRAQRFARVQAAEMRLRDADAVQAGRTRRDLYAVLREPIDTAREAFRRTFYAECPSMVDYLHLELVRTLANDDAELLGKDYPGPMV